MDNRLNANQTASEPPKTFFRSNPVMNRLNKVDAVPTDGKPVSYGRIAVKTAWFLLVTMVGIMGYLLLSSFVFADDTDVLEFTYNNLKVSAPKMALLAAGGAILIAIVTQLMAAFMPRTIPVTGTIYSLSQGFIISFTVFSLLKGYEYLGLLALVITIVVVMTMALLYIKRIIKVSKKFVMIITTLFASMVGISLLSFFGYLIPFTRPFVSSIMGNFGVSVTLTVASIVLACLFLISDFAVIEHVVENKLPAKYEWMASFGLVFTVLWIYVKILDLLVKIVGKNSKS